jgi:thiol-disulfide isomerase/thioredoxin
VSTLSAGPIRLSGLRGKVVLLNFWATWCVSCRTEMPGMETLYRKYRNEGFEVVAVNMDVLSTAGVEKFVEEVAVTFPIALDPSWSTARTYGVVGLPTSYLIDRDGNVVAREVGPRNWADAVSEGVVKELLKRAGKGDER